MPFFRNQRQYQTLAFVAVVLAPNVCNVTSSSQVVFETQFQYQSYTEPVFGLTPPVVPAVSSPVIFEFQFQYQSLSTFSPGALTPPEISNTLSPVIFSKTFQYPSLAHTPFIPPEIVAIDKWNYPWSEPVRVKPRLLEGLQQAQAQVLIPPTPPVQQTSIAQLVSANVQYETRIQYQSQARPTFVPVTETVTVDKWFKPFDDPVRHKIGLRASLQQAFIAPVLADEQITGTFESRWHQPWSEPVRFRRFPTSEQQAQIQGAIFVPEVITVDKWIYQWTDPVRLKIGLRASLQQALIAPVLTDDQITGTIESRWHQGWSEPVRFRQFPTSEQQALIQGPAQTPEFITVDKWIYPWTDPVKQKIGLKTHLQTSLIAPVLNPETQITQGIESRWHFAWSEPVRFRQLATALQQTVAAPATSVFENIFYDKWGFAWSEPVRQKVGLKTHLQQAFIGLTLNPETQIIQTYESRWHFAWSEPVRIKPQVPAGEQQAVIQGPIQTPEFITVDKWVYAWSEPVRQKIGIAVRLQQAFIAPVLTDEQLIGTIEARWHQPWSEPVRFRRFPTAEQPSYTAPATSVFETITVDKWIYAWSEPVRQKIGIKANLQQAFIGLTLNPETQIIQGYESRWHQPWSEPVRRKVSVANQPSSLWVFTPPAAVSQSSWYLAFSEPVRFNRFATSEQPSFFAPTTIVPPQIFIDKWGYPWVEPVRKKIWLNTTLQQTFAAPVIPNPIFVASVSSPVIFTKTFQYPSYTAPTTIVIVPQVGTTSLGSQVTFEKWFIYDPYVYPIPFPPPPPPSITTLSSPVIFTKWFIYEPQAILLRPFTVEISLLATEINADVAFFGVTVYNQIAPVAPVANTVVSIKEIPAVRKADVSTEEIEAIDNADVSIKET